MVEDHIIRETAALVEDERGKYLGAIRRIFGRRKRCKTLRLFLEDRKDRFQSEADYREEPTTRKRELSENAWIFLEQSQYFQEARTSIRSKEVLPLEGCMRTPPSALP